MMMTSSAPESPASATEDFLYDHLGNRYQETTKNGIVFTYSHNPVNQYAKREAEILGIPIEETYAHDDNGNLSMDAEGNSYTYDYRNRITVIQDKVQFRYDALGRRFYKKDLTTNTETYYYFDTDNRIVAQYVRPQNETAELDRSFVYGNGVSEVLCMFTPYQEGNPNWLENLVSFCDAWLSDENDPNTSGRFNEIFDHNNDGFIDLQDFSYFASVLEIPSSYESNWYYLTDAAGSVRGLIGGRFNRENEREFYNYDVYGETADFSEVGNPFMFHGKFVACTEPLVYSRFYRDYLPSLGRWAQFDPIADSMNLYEYVSSNPFNRIDPFGLFELEWEGKWNPAERKKLLDSMERIKSRCKELDGQIDNEIKNLPKDKCYDKIRKELSNLKKLLNDVRNGINSKGENLELYQEKFKEDDDALARTILPLIFLDNEIHMNSRDSSDWHSFTEEDLDNTFFHEITHLYGTEDDDSKGDFMNAHIIDDLLKGDISKNTFLRYWKMKCQKPCDKKTNDDPNKQKEMPNVKEK
jgi:RHS repeat-associated protein